jgi:hypothetical protein
MARRLIALGCQKPASTVHGLRSTVADQTDCEGGQMSKHTKKFLRWKSYLKMAMTPGEELDRYLDLQNWRDCQALLACGFKVVGQSAAGTYFDMPVFSSMLGEDTERSLCLTK